MSIRKARSFRFFGRGLPEGAYRIGGQLTPGVRILLVGFALTCLLSNIPGAVSTFIREQLVLTPALAIGVKPWQIVTGPLILTSVLGLLFTGLLLWSISSAVEQQLGKRRFLLLSLAASLAASAVAALVGVLIPASRGVPILFEAGPLFMAHLVAFAARFGGERMSMWGIGQPVSGRGLSGFFIGLGLVMYLLQGMWPELFGALAALAVGARMGGGTSLLASLRRSYKEWRVRRQRSRYTVLDGGEWRGRGQREAKDRRWVN